MNLLKNFSKIFLFAVILLLQFALAATNLNTANESEIEALPSVGAKIAKDIVAARPFKTVDDLKNVRGIGAAKFKKIEPMVSLTNETTAAPAAAPAGGSKKQLAQGEMININTASKEELQRLPGIGEKKAEEIIQARFFKTAEDLTKVKSIRQGIFNKLKDHVAT